MATPQTDEKIETHAIELDCAPLLVPVVERLDRIISLLEAQAYRAEQASQQAAEAYQRAKRRVPRNK